MTRFVPIEYAKPPPWYRRRAFRWALLVLVIALICPLVMQLARFAQHRWEVHQLYRACAGYTAAPTRPVYDESPPEVARLARLPEYSTVGSLNGPAVFAVVPAWQAFCAADDVGQIQSYGTLFLGQRQTPTGKRRLIGVDITGWFRGGAAPILSTHVRAFEPTPLVQLPPQRDARTFNLALGTREGTLRLFAGQSDQHDPSHFTIAYSVGDTPGLIDGWLKDDGTVLLETRSP